MQLHTAIAILSLSIWLICYLTDKGGALMQLSMWAFLVSLGFVYLKGI